MAFRRGAAGKRRDATEPAIVEALRGLGCEIHYVSGLGLPDLLVRSPRGRWVPLEVKTAKGKMKPSQVAITWPVVRSVDEAIEAVLMREPDDFTESDLRDEIATLRAEQTRLREALEPYLRHLWDCDRQLAFIDDPKCTCGLEAALSSTPTPEPSHRFRGQVGGDRCLDCGEFHLHPNHVTPTPETTP